MQRNPRGGYQGPPTHHNPGQHTVVSGGGYSTTSREHGHGPVQPSHLPATMVVVQAPPGVYPSPLAPTRLTPWDQARIALRSAQENLQREEVRARGQQYPATSTYHQHTPHSRVPTPLDLARNAVRDAQETLNQLEREPHRRPGPY